MLPRSGGGGVGRVRIGIDTASGDMVIARCAVGCTVANMAVCCAFVGLAV